MIALHFEVQSLDSPTFQSKQCPQTDALLSKSFGFEMFVGQIVRWPNRSVVKSVVSASASVQFVGGQPLIERLSDHQQSIDRFWFWRAKVPKKRLLRFCFESQQSNQKSLSIGKMAHWSAIDVIGDTDSVLSYLFRYLQISKDIWRYLKSYRYVTRSLSCICPLSLISLLSSIEPQ